jgi:hypothetical protein
MTSLRRIALSVAIGCAVLAAWTSAAAARVAEDYMQDDAYTTQSSDPGMLIWLAAFAVLVVAIAAGATYRTRRRAVA